MAEMIPIKAREGFIGSEGRGRLRLSIALRGCAIPYPPVVAMTGRCCLPGPTTSDSQEVL